MTGPHRALGEPGDDEPTRPQLNGPPPSEEWAVAQLRHLFQLMVQGHLRTQRHIEAHARKLLGPAIDAIETAQAARAVHRRHDT